MHCKRCNDLGYVQIIEDNERVTVDCPDCTETQKPRPDWDF